MFRLQPGFFFYLLGVSLALTFANAEDKTSNWIGGSVVWGSVSSWDNGVPNNSGGDNYTAVINLPNSSVRPSISGLQVSNLQLLEGQIEGVASLASFTVLNETTINPEKVGNFFGIKPAAIFKINVTGSNKVIFNLGKFGGESNGALLGGRYELITRSETAEAIVAWENAAVTKIGPKAEIILEGTGLAELRNSLDGSDALTGVTLNEGGFKMRGRGFDFAGSFTNAGTFAINEAITLGESSDLVQFTTRGDFTNTGNATIQSNSSATNFNIDGDLNNEGILTYTLSNFSGSPQTLSPMITGDLVNAGGLTFRSDDQEVTWNIGGLLSNTGDLLLQSNRSNLTVNVEGGFGGTESGVLPSGFYRLLANKPGDFATVSTEGIDIRTIGEDATIHLEGAGASFLNQASGNSALAHLAVVDGVFKVRGQTLTLPDGFTNRGTVEFISNSDFGAQVLSFDGPFSNTGSLEIHAFNLLGQSGAEVRSGAMGSLTENSGGVLTAGHLVVDGDIDASAIMEWPGAEINSIGAQAGITLVGPHSHIRNQTSQADALANLVSNAGVLTYLLRDGSTPENFVNDSGSERPAEFTVHDGNFTIGGNFTNTGETLVRGEDAPASLTVGSGISNTGALEVYADENSVLVSIAGLLNQQVGSTLREGELDVRADSGLSAILEYEGAGIDIIGPNASISIDGSGAIIRDKLTMADALEPLTTIEGELTLNDGKSRVFGSNLTVSGSLDLRNANYRVAGNFVNPGRTEFNRLGQAGKVFIVDGAFSNPGELIIYNGGVFTANSGLGQQTGSVLDNIDITLNGGVAEWEDAAITKIGANGGLGLSGEGSSVRNVSGGADALTGLVENDGYFFLEDFTFTFSGDFSNTGEMELSTAVILAMVPGATLSSSDNFENGGKNSLTGGKLQLLKGGTFTTWDVFKEYGPHFQAIFEFAQLTAPEIQIDGDLYLEVYDLKPEPDTEYTIMEAPLITGGFENVAFGGRITLYDGNEEDGTVPVGTFSLNFDSENGRIFLADFEGVGPPQIEIESLQMAGNKFTLNWNVSDGSGADVFFSTKPEEWGDPVASGLLSGVYQHTFPSIPARGFFIVLPEGTGPP